MIAFDALLATVTPALSPGQALSLSDLFTFLFIVIGPLKLLGPFLQATRGLDAVQLRSLAVRSTLVAAASLVLGGFVGCALLEKWKVDPQILLLCLGMIFFVVAFRLVMRQYTPAARAATDAPPPVPGVLQIVFPMIAPPYGTAAVIALLAVSPSSQGTLLVCGLVLANLALDLLAMIFVRSIMKGVWLAVIQVMGALIGVLQVALAVRIILGALTRLGVIGTA